jgi:hypothetical protein
LTLSFSESPSGGGGSLLSDVLETGAPPEKYFLSPKACAGILRRAEARRKQLPPLLRAVLAAQVQPIIDKPKPGG